MSSLKPQGENMKCIACGREMVNKGLAFVCTNLLCDYEEEIDNTMKISVHPLENPEPTVAWR